jgi:hypothetical protein
MDLRRFGGRRRRRGVVVYRRGEHCADPDDELFSRDLLPSLPETNFTIAGAGRRGGLDLEL